jgi:hypothetical protein
MGGTITWFSGCHPQIPGRGADPEQHSLAGCPADAGTFNQHASRFFIEKESLYAVRLEDGTELCSTVIDLESVFRIIEIILKPDHFFYTSS